MTGIEKFAELMQLQMNKSIPRDLILDFGTINTDYSLQSNMFKVPIPVSDYLICRGLSKAKSAAVTVTSESAGVHEHNYSTTSGTPTNGVTTHTHSVNGTTESAGAHAHQVTIPDRETKLKPGDRVLLAWVGTDAVVIDVIIPATEVI